MYIKTDAALYTKSKQQKSEENPTPVRLNCHSANGRDGLFFAILDVQGAGETLLEVACPQILKSALPGGGPKGSKLLYYYCFNTDSI